MSTQDSASEPPPKKRIRARKACLPCRQRKRKCDVQFPCSMCTTYGYQCQYPADDGPSAKFVDRGGHCTVPVPASRTTASPQSPASESNETISSPVTANDPGILDAEKSRYMGLASAVAFPRNLGLQFQSTEPPRLHSFGWNCGIRAEEEGTAHHDLKKILSREDFFRYAQVYFTTVNPVFGILDLAHFLTTVDKYWIEVSQPSSFEAVIAGVVALGSFFSATLGHPKEALIVQHAKDLLEDPTFHPSIDQVCAWILRTIYLRNTTRPQRSWMASCQAVHLAEATGMHSELPSSALENQVSARSIVNTANGREQARRIFWIAWHTNTMVSFEYGRSTVVLNNITCPKPAIIPGDSTYHLISIASLAPTTTNGDNSSKLPDLLNTFAALMKIPEDEPFIQLSKADLCMSMYRHTRLLKQPLEKSTILDIIKIGNAATAAALSLAQACKFWFNVLCTVFQYVCVLLAIDTSDSLSAVIGAMATLDKITALLGTHVATEASNTVKVLLRDSMKKKRLEVSLLEAADKGTEQQLGLSVEDLNGMGENLNIDWDVLLDPWFMSGFAVQDFSVSGDGGVWYVPTV